MALLSPEQIDQLVNDYTPLARSIAASYTSLAYDDRMQEAMLGLVIAATKYDTERGYFSPFARTVIRQRLNLFYRAERHDLYLHDSHPIEDAGLNEVESRVATEEFVASLPEREQQLVGLWRDDKRQATVCARELGTHRTTVARMAENIKEKFYSD